MIRCWLIPTPAAKAGAVHRGIRHARRVRRAAIIVCVSIGGFGTAAGAPFFLSPPLVPPPAAAPSGWPESPWADVTSRDGHPIPEPSSLALLAGAWLAMLLAGARR